MHKTVASLLIVVIMLTAFLVGCSSTPTSTVEESHPERTVEVTQQVVATKEVVLTTIDDSGRVVTIVGTPQRIVSIASAATEALYAIGSGDKIVGVDKYSDYPPEVQQKPQVGSGSQLDVEAVLGLEPDLVIAWWFSTEAISTLEDKGLTVLAINPKSVDGVLYTIRTLGLITGHSDEAKSLTVEMQARIDKIKARVKDISKKDRPLVYYELTTPLKTAGSGTFTNELIFMAGGINIAADEPVSYPILNTEYIIERNPDVIIVVSGGALVEDIQSREGWQNIKAVQDGRVYTIDTHLVTSNPRIVEGLEQFADWFHPGEK